MNLFDSHFHLDRQISAAEYARQAEDAGVRYLMAVASNFEESLAVQKFAHETANSWFAAGVHPHEAAKYSEGLDQFAKFAADPQMLAVGEIGLDYYYENSARRSQVEIFSQFLEWAGCWHKPVIVHCRDRDGTEAAYLETYELLKGFSGQDRKFVLHCYTGSVRWAEKFLDIGAYLGMTGIVTFPGAEKVREVLKMIPDDRLLLETDSPYLAPVPHRGKKNCSAYLADIAKFVAGLRDCSLEEITAQTTANAFTLFQLQIKSEPFPLRPDQSGMCQRSG